MSRGTSRIRDCTNCALGADDRGQFGVSARRAARELRNWGGGLASSRSMRPSRSGGTTKQADSATGFPACERVTGMGCRQEISAPRLQAMRRRESACWPTSRPSAQPLVDRGADVIIPAGVLPGLLIAPRREHAHGFKVGHAPVVNCAAVALKSGGEDVGADCGASTAPSRAGGPSFRALANESTCQDFHAAVARTRTAKPRPPGQNALRGEGTARQGLYEAEVTATGEARNGKAASDDEVVVGVIIAAEDRWARPGRAGG